MIHTIKRILDMVGERKNEIYKAVILRLIHSLFSAFSLFAIIYVIEHIEYLSLPVIRNTIILLMIGVIGQFICKWRGSIRVSRLAYDTFRDKRLEIGEKLKAAPMGYYNSQNLGSITAAVTTGMNELEGNAVTIVEDMLGCVIYSVVSTMILFCFNRYVGIATFLALVVSCGLLVFIQKASNKFAKKQVISRERMTGSVIEFVRGIMVMRLFAFHGEEQKKVTESYKMKKEADLLVENTVTLPVMLYGFIFKLLSCVVIFISASLCLTGQLPLSYAMMFLLSAFILNSSVSTMGANIALLKVIESALLHFDTVLNMPVLSGEQEIDEHNSLEISVENIEFGYKDETVIKNVSMQIPYGTKNAIIGTSGSGKTTMCNLIARFYEVDKGCIKLGGVNIKEIKPEELLKKISFVFQDVYLFEDSVINNIRFGKPDATLEEVMIACEKARCHEFIMSMENGYETRIGEAGANLSGGEKQRISIARAIMKDAPIIILDEATSSVDAENEYLLLEALEELCKDKTVISIAHRLSTVVNADNIYVMHKGEIIQNGTHEELIRRNGMYRNFVQIRQEALSWGIEN